MTKDMRRLLAPAFLTLAAACSGAHAQTPAEFYKGKTLTITVGFSPGGGYDQYARVLARHIGRHTPGDFWPTAQYSLTRFPSARSARIRIPRPSARRSSTSMISPSSGPVHGYSSTRTNGWKDGLLQSSQLGV